MKQIISQLDKSLENRIRLGIMIALKKNEQLDFISLRKLLDVSDGNLATHLKGLENLDYLEVRKRFIGRKPNTSYFNTIKGEEALRNHLDALTKLMKY